MRKEVPMRHPPPGNSGSLTEPAARILPPTRARAERGREDLVPVRNNLAVAWFRHRLWATIARTSDRFVVCELPGKPGRQHRRNDLLRWLVGQVPECVPLRQLAVQLVEHTLCHPDWIQDDTSEQSTDVQRAGPSFP